MMQAVIVLTVLGATLGALLGFAETKLRVEVDTRVKGVLERLPGVNCGGCGYPGCPGFAEALVAGDVKKVSACVASNQAAWEEIKEYLETTPDIEGNVIKVSV